MRRPCVAAFPLEGRQPFVDGGAHERVHESERRARAQDVDPGEIGARRGGCGLVEPGERGRLMCVCVVAEDRHRLGKPRRRLRQAGEANRDGA